MNKHHLLISGTGRAGTTFLVQLLTELGLETGYSSSADGIQRECNAGMEWPIADIFKRTAPYVVKAPVLAEHINEVLGEAGITVDFMIIPIRELYAAAESRRTVSRQVKRRGAAGGLWLTKKPGRQEAALAMQFHHLVHALAKHDVPVIWLHFPRLVKDAEYLYNKLQPALPGIDFAAFGRAFQAVSRPELVHDFKPNGVAKGSVLRRLNAWMTARLASKSVRRPKDAAASRTAIPGA
jgi:hypothetical protein